MSLEIRGFQAKGFALRSAPHPILSPKEMVYGMGFDARFARGIYPENRVSAKRFSFISPLVSGETLLEDFAALSTGSVGAGREIWSTLYTMIY